MVHLNACQITERSNKELQHNNPPQTLDSDLGVDSPQHSGIVVD